MTFSPNQRMFHSCIRSATVVDQLSAHFNDRQRRVSTLAGEEKAPHNPKVCQFYGMSNNPELKEFVACGAALPTDLPRVGPKCGRGHKFGALFCQSFRTHLVEG